MFHQQTEDTDGERKRLEGWWFKLQKPFSPQSVILLARTASCLLCFFLLPSLYSPFNADLITNMSSVRLPLCTLPPGFIWVRVQCSGSPKRHCSPASMGLPPWPRPRAPFSHLFKWPQRNIIGLTVTRKGGEITRKGQFKKYYLKKRFVGTFDRVFKCGFGRSAGERVGVRIQTGKEFD